MRGIEIKILNEQNIKAAEKMMIFSARITQRAEKLKNMDDLIELYNKPYSERLVRTINKLPHQTLKRFENINIAVVGASRRFANQIVRHQAGVQFISGSLQYSNYSDEAEFVIPYEILEAGEEAEAKYLHSCELAMESYKELNSQLGVDSDACGYATPYGLRNVLVISANVTAWQHMISQRTCKRNSLETRYIFLKIWAQLYELAPEMFSPACSGAPCQKSRCGEGRLTCGKPVNKVYKPVDILEEDFPLIYKKAA